MCSNDGPDRRIDSSQKGQTRDKGSLRRQRNFCARQQGTEQICTFSPFCLDEKHGLQESRHRIQGAVADFDVIVSASIACCRDEEIFLLIELCSVEHGQYRAADVNRCQPLVLHLFLDFLLEYSGVNRINCFCALTFAHVVHFHLFHKMLNYIVVGRPTLLYEVNIVNERNWNFRHLHPPYTNGHPAL